MQIRHDDLLSMHSFPYVNAQFIRSFSNRNVRSDVQDFRKISMYLGIMAKIEKFGFDSQLLFKTQFLIKMIFCRV